MAGESKRAVFYELMRYQLLDHTIIVLRARNDYGKSVLARMRGWQSDGKAAGGHMGQFES
jgi:hypothetical protein